MKKRENPPFDCVLASWRLHEAALRAYLASRLGDTATAEDLLQEVFLRALRAGEGLRRIDNPRAWLFRVARNALVDHVRRRRPHTILPDELPAPETARAPVDELDACLRRNLAELADTDRDIIQQCDLEGLRQQDYAARHGLSLPATKARLLRARRRLREALVRNCQVRFDERGRVCCHVPRE